MANLQPDDRGEYMLLPNHVSQAKYVCKSFTLNTVMNVDQVSREKPLCLK